LAKLGGCRFDDTVSDIAEAMWCPNPLLSHLFHPDEFYTYAGGVIVSFIVGLIALFFKQLRIWFFMGLAPVVRLIGKFIAHIYRAVVPQQKEKAFPNSVVLRPKVSQLDLLTGTGLVEEKLQSVSVDTVGKLGFGMSYWPEKTEELSYRNQFKQELYGGLPAFNKESIFEELSPLEIVGWGLPITRELTEDILIDIENLGAGFRTHNVFGLPGQGKTFLLAELAKTLTEKPSYLCFWDISDDDSVFKSNLSKKETDALFEQLPINITHLVYLVDDIDKKNASAVNNIAKMFSNFQSLADKFQIGVDIIFSTCDSQSFVHKNSELSGNSSRNLLLTQKDENRIYEKLANQAPRLIQGFDGGLAELYKNKERKKQYGNNLRNYFEYLFRYCEPLKDFSQSRFGFVDKLEGDDKRVLQKIITPQLFGLQLPLRVAQELGVDHENLASKFSGRVALVSPNNWHGSWEEETNAGPIHGTWVGEPYKAEAILHALGGDNIANVVNSLNEIIGLCFEQGLKLGENSRILAEWRRVELEFVRHIFHRIGKQYEYQLFSGDDPSSVYMNKNDVLRQLLRFNWHHLEDYFSTPRPTVEMAKWAATLAKTPNFAPNQNKRDLSKVATLVKDLCVRIRENAEPNELCLDSHALLSYFLAVRKLGVKYKNSREVIQLAEDSRIKLAPAEWIDTLILYSNDNSRRNRRINSVITEFLKFENATSNLRGWKLRNRIEHFYDFFEVKLNENNLHLDSVNWLNRFDKEIAPEVKRRYLAEAKKSIDSEPLVQGRSYNTWLKKSQYFDRKYSINK